MTRYYQLICPECDSEEAVSVISRKEAVDAVICKACETVNDPTAFQISGAEHDALIEEVSQLSSVLNNIQDMYVTLDTLADSNDMSPAVIRRLRRLQSDTNDVLGFVKEEHAYRLKVSKELIQ